MSEAPIQPIVERGCGPLSPLFDEALVWAASLHRSQPRKGTKVPYMAHLMGVSSLVLEDGGTEVEAIAGLLHDAVEDCGKEIEPNLRRKFGDRVADIVLECSDDTPDAGGEKRPWAERKEEYVHHLADASLSAVRVCAADKLHNARATLSDLSASGRWPEANACPHQSLWFYEAVSAVVSRRLDGSRAAKELAVVVDGLYEATRGVDRPADHSQSVPACPGGADCTIVAPTPESPHATV